MRWLLLVGLTTCCMAEQSTPPKEVSIYSELRHEARFTSARAILIGVVVSSSSEVHQSPVEIMLEETCTLRIEAIYGTIAELEGATSARFDTSYEHDKYVQLEPDWGTYRHLKVGQRVVALLDEDEGHPKIGSHGLIVLNEASQTLPDILRRTGSDASRFTTADLVVLEAASPLFHGEVIAIAEVMADMRQEEAAFLNQLVGVCVLLAFAGILWADHFSRRQHAAPGYNARL